MKTFTIDAENNITVFARMIERSQNLRLAREAGQTVSVGCEQLGQDFQGRFARQFRIDSTPDLAHATLSEFGRDSVVSDRLLRAHT